VCGLIENLKTKKRSARW